MSASAAVRSFLRSHRTGEDAAVLSAVVSGDEAAFAELVRRHGPVVLGVCRRVLGPSADADDAFQLTFLALAKHAKSVHTPAALPGWLHRTATRAALKLKAQVVSRFAGKSPFAPRKGALSRSERRQPETCTADPLADLTWKEVRAALDEELARLPDSLRGPLVLCYLDGRPRDDAATALGISPSTLKRRLADGLEVLRDRLTRRGVAGVGLALAALCGHGLTAQVPPPLAQQVTAAFRTLPALGTAAVGWKVVLVAVLLTGGLTTAGVLLLPQPAQVKAPPAAKDDKPQAKPKTDAFGDPLPDGAVLRLGTVGFRVPVLRGGVGFRKTGELVAFSEDLAVHVWPADGSPKATTTLLTGKKEYGWRRAMSADARFAAGFLTREGKNLVVVWDVSGDKPTEYLTRDFKDVYKIAFSPNGEWLAVNESVRGEKESLHMCHLPTKEWTGYAVGQDHFESLSFAANGGRLAVGMNLNAAVIDPTEKKTVRVTLPRENALFAALSPDGKALALRPTTFLSRPAPSVRLYSVESGAEVAKFESAIGFNRWVGFAPDGKSVWVGGTRGVREYEPQTGKLLREIPGPAEHPMAFSADGKRLATCSESAVMVCDLKQGKVVRPDLIEGGHTQPISGVAFSPDVKIIATHTRYDEVRLWDAATGRPVGQFVSTGGRGGWIAFLPDSKSCFVVADDYTSLVLREVPGGKELKRFTVPADVAKQESTQEVRLSADAKTLITTSQASIAGGKAYTVRWDAETGEILDRVEIQRNTQMEVFEGFAQSPDGRWVVRNGALSREGEGKVAQVVPPKEVSFGNPARFSADGRLLTMARPPRLPKPDERGSGSLVVYDLVARAPLVELPVGNPLRHTLSPDGRQVGVFARTPEREEVAVWDLATGKKAWSVPAEHGNVIWSDAIAFTPDGRRLITGHDCTALVWDIAAPKPKPGTTDASKLWEALAGGDAVAAHKAGWELVDRPAEAVALLREKLKPVKAADEAAVKALVAKLGDKEFAEREAATKELRQLGDAAKPGLRAALKGELSSEQTERVERLLAAAKDTAAPTGDALRGVRAVAVLERIGSAEARKLLGELAAGLPDARLTQEATAAVGRVKK